MRKVGKKAPRPFDRLAEAAAEQSSRRVTNNITQEALCNDIRRVSKGRNNIALLILHCKCGISLRDGDVTTF